MTKSEYLKLRDRFTPENPKIMFVLESPPASGLYFYNPDGKTTEPLFKAMMKDVLEIEPRSKEAGLNEFSARGFFLVDATYTPVNRLEDEEKEAMILRDFPSLVEDLRKHAKPDTRLVLVKANLCRLLEPTLTAVGFNVHNQGVKIPFPSTGQQGKFRTAIRNVLEIRS